DAINDDHSDTIDTGCYQFTYQYEEAIADFDRGWQGFKRLVITDEQHNTETTQTHSVSYPLTGRLLNKTTREADSQRLMGIEEYAYHSCQRGVTGAYDGHCENLPNGAHRVFLDDKLQHHYTMGTANYTLMTRNGYFQPHLSNGQPITVTYDGDAQRAAGDGAYTRCYQFADATDDQWWKRSFATYIKQTAWHGGNCFTAASGWDSTKDLNWQYFRFDERMNVTSKGVYLDKTTSTDSSGHWLGTYSTYDEYGNVLTQTQMTGLVTLLTYDATHTFVTQQKSIGAGLTLTSTFEHDAGTGLRILETSPQGFQSKSILDEFGRVIEIQQTGPDDTSLVTMATMTYQKSPTQTDRIEVITRHRKDWNNDVVSSWPASTKLYDGMGTAFEAYKPGDSWQYTITGDKTYNHKGQVNKAYFAYLGNSSADRGAYNQYTYDEHGRLTRVESSFDGQATEYDYNLHDDRAIIKKMESPTGGGQVSYKTQHNTRGKVIAQTGPSSGITRYEYDPLNRVTKITDPLAQQRLFTYNSLGQKLSDSSAETGTMTYAYDSYGRLSSQTDATGRTVRRTYDARSRIIKQVAQYENDTTETTYSYQDTPKLSISLFGRLAGTSVTTNGQVVVQNAYRYTLKGLKTMHFYTVNVDGSGGIGGDAQDIHLIEFSYDAMDQLASLTYPDGSVATFNHGQAGNNLLTSVDYAYAVNSTENNIQDILVNYQNFHVNGKAKSVTYGNGIIETRVFDDIGRLLESEVANASSPLLQRSYTWNRANKLTAVTDLNNAGLDQDFTYDHSGHLVQASGAYGDITISNDVAGNRTAYNDQTYGYDTGKKHQLLTVTNADGSKVERRYDDAGYLSSKTSAAGHFDYHWDGNGNLISVTRGTGSAAVTVNEFAYNESNNRVIKRDYTNGALVRTTHYLPGLYEVVVDEATGNKSYTNYLAGVAARTETVNRTQGLAYNTVEDRIMLHTGMAYASVMPTSLAQLDQWFTGVGLILTHNNLGARIIATLLWVSLVSGLFIYLVLQLLRSAGKDSVLGQFRHACLIRLVAYGWLSRTRARHWDTPLQRDWYQAPSLSRFCLVGVMCLCTLGNVFTPAYAALTAGTNGAGVPVEGQFQYFHRDQVASTSMVTNAGGGVLSKVEYTPFGKMVENQSSGMDNYRAKFAGKERDSGTGLSYFGHRYYDADIGRFISPDPAAQYHSPYLYGADDPLTMVDPNGEWSWKAFAIGVLVVVAIVAVTVATAGVGTAAAVAAGTAFFTTSQVALGAGVAVVAVGLGASMVESSSSSLGAKVPFVGPIDESAHGTKGMPLSKEQQDDAWFKKKTQAIARLEKLLTYVRHAKQDDETYGYEFLRRYFGNDYRDGKVNLKQIEYSVRGAIAKLKSDNTKYTVVPLRDGRSAQVDSRDLSLIKFDPEVFSSPEIADKVLTRLIIHEAIHLVSNGNGNGMHPDEGGPEDSNEFYDKDAYKKSEGGIGAYNAENYACAALSWTPQKFDCGV
ncbi:RHS repeat-associated core domain-containing protein, partial [Marinomonas transparens]